MDSKGDVSVRIAGAVFRVGKTTNDSEAPGKSGLKASPHIRIAFAPSGGASTPGSSRHGSARCLAATPPAIGALLGPACCPNSHVGASSDPTAMSALRNIYQVQGSKRLALLRALRRLLLPALQYAAALERQNRRHLLYGPTSESMLEQTSVGSNAVPSAKEAALRDSLILHASGDFTIDLSSNDGRCLASLPGGLELLRNIGYAHASGGMTPRRSAGGSAAPLRSISTLGNSSSKRPGSSLSSVASSKSTNGSMVLSVAEVRVAATRRKLRAAFWGTSALLDLSVAEGSSQRLLSPEATQGGWAVCGVEWASEAPTVLSCASKLFSEDNINGTTPCLRIEALMHGGDYISRQTLKSSAEFMTRLGCAELPLTSLLAPDPTSHWAATAAGGGFNSHRVGAKWVWYRAVWAGPDALLLLEMTTQPWSIPSRGALSSAGATVSAAKVENGRASKGRSGSDSRNRTSSRRASQPHDEMQPMESGLQHFFALAPRAGIVRIEALNLRLAKPLRQLCAQHSGAKLWLEASFVSASGGIESSGGTSGTDRVELGLRNSAVVADTHGAKDKSGTLSLVPGGHNPMVKIA